MYKSKKSGSLTLDSLPILIILVLMAVLDSCCFFRQTTCSVISQLTEILPIMTELSTDNDVTFNHTDGISPITILIYTKNERRKTSKHFSNVTKPILPYVRVLL